MLLLGRVDMMHVREAQRVFDHLDKDKTGILNETDVVKKVEQQTGLRYDSARYRMGHGAKDSKKYASPRRLAALKKGGEGGGTMGAEGSSSSSNMLGTSPIKPKEGGWGEVGEGREGGDEGRLHSLSSVSAPSSSTSPWRWRQQKQQQPQGGGGEGGEEYKKG